jgi:opine dehydrogenase
MRIAILGGGHGCYAAAADLAEQGHEIRLWRRDAPALSALGTPPVIRLKDYQGTRAVSIALATPDIGAVIRGAELLLLPLPAFTQVDVAGAMAPHVTDGQVAFLPPGTFGSYVMARTLREAGCRARITFAETGTLPYLARKHGPAELAITVRAKRLPTGVFPSLDSDRALNIIRQAYPAIEPIEDALSGALMNAGPIIHPPLILMNAGPLEYAARAGDADKSRLFDIHNEGTQPAVRAVTDRLDEERIAVREALGYKPYHFPLRDHYTSDRWMYGNAHDKLTDSNDWRENIPLRTHRYMREDVEYGLAFLVSAARWAGVQAPVANGLLALASTICATDFGTTSPRTLESLGLASQSNAAMQTLLQNGL